MKKNITLILLFCSVSSVAFAMDDAAELSYAQAPASAGKWKAARLQMEAENERASLIERKIRTMTLERQLLEEGKRLDDLQGRGGLPALKGISGAGDNLVAEFSEGKAAIRAVREGAHITSQWRVSAIRHNAVEVVNDSGRRRVLLVGHDAE